MSQTLLASYLTTHPQAASNPEMVGFVAQLEVIIRTAPEVARAIVKELRDQRRNIKLIASENYSSLATQFAMANLFTDKYAEGYPGHRFYAGCDNVDEVESLACEEAKALFGAQHAYVQPHSGADANLVAFWAVLQWKVQAPALEKLGKKNLYDLSKEEWEALRKELGNQRLLGLDYYSGGHLTHGYRYNVSAQMFEAYSYGVNPETGLLDYDEIARLAREIRPLILLAGYSAYPRKIDFARLREIADEVGAVLMVDMAHFAGLVAGGVFEGPYNPVPHAHIVTSTTHKTLRGPRGGIVLCVKELAEFVDKGCPMVLGGPLPHVIAAKAVALREARSPAFREYAHKIVENAQALAAFLQEEGITVATGGTDNHLMLIDVRPFGITGRQAEAAVRECGITLNRNALPYDPNGPWYTSGLRIGTPAVTTLGMGREEMREIARIFKLILTHVSPEVKDGSPSKARYHLDPGAKEEARSRVEALLSRFPLYPRLDLAFLEEALGLQG
ncbi:glycine hydroxymethyltransferase [Spirochaeta thermophila DSM 6578]|uniref:Serine hydroxymethyltransferase n=1 Tax=Winmispira thermophila (strain ATCC 700085 / DSM 6578 / Z-1203) TaxID=869211 RepID=G0GC81_WINT7|nr:glycine hydroxymethyltransferase [Spirochaeta thermophila]AEJ60445.1 glycine hydroxymethyltransferase [Spirochaeta thermophila DSM 6578]